MKLSPEGIDIIKEFEGFRAEPYLCAAGKPTIGYGHLILPFEKFTKLTEDDAEKILLTDVAITEKSVLKFVKVPISQGQFDALVSFTFNLGWTALSRSSLLKRLNEGNYKAAADNFQRWVFANNVRLPGLVRRRAAEWKMFTGE